MCAGVCAARDEPCQSVCGGREVVCAKLCYKTAKQYISYDNCITDHFGGLDGTRVHHWTDWHDCRVAVDVSVRARTAHALCLVAWAGAARYSYMLYK